MSFVIRLICILVIVVLWAVATYWALSSVRQIWGIRNVDSGLTTRLAARALAKNPFAGLVAQLRERAELQVSWSLQEGYTFRPREGQVINLEGRRQYLLVIANPTKETLAPVELRAQFPYPVDESVVAKSTGADGVNFQEDQVLNVAGSGQVQVLRRPLFKDYQLTIGELRPQGRVEILVVLDSSRIDPRARMVPNAQGGADLVPDWGPSVTYIHGHFKYAAGTETVTKEYYAPLELHENRFVVLGPAGTRPERLSVRRGIQ